MNPACALAVWFDPARILLSQRMTPDPWQRELLHSSDQFTLLNCSRQSGKSTTVAALALHQLITKPGSLVLLVGPSERQSKELFRKVLAGFQALDKPIATLHWNQRELELMNGSRLVALPGREETIRSFSGVRLLVLDEAARVPDDLYRSVRPMLAVSQGRLFALTTPFGPRGWFWKEWFGQGPWRRQQVPWTMCPRIRPEFIEEKERALGKIWVEQEYLCDFTALEGLVYPDFHLALCDDPEPPKGSWVGGIDFGYRNPFAAVWGVLDRDDVLWILGERHAKSCTATNHARAIQKATNGQKIFWHADPAGANEIAELRLAGLQVRPAKNDIRPGIARLTERIRTGRLKVARSCEHLIAEAGLYRYPTESERARDGENPHDKDNHSLAALRYLVMALPAARREHEMLIAQEPPAQEWDDHWQSI